MSDSLGLDRDLKVEEFDLPDEEEPEEAKFEGGEAPADDEAQYDDAGSDDL